MEALKLTSLPDIAPDTTGALGAVIKVDFTRGVIADEKRTTSLYKSNGIPKPTTADPIREKSDIQAMQQYFREHSIRNYTLFTVGIIFGLRASDILDLKMHHILMPDGRFKSHCDLIEKKTRKFNNPAITPEIAQLLTEYLCTLSEIQLDDPLFQSREKDKNTGRPKGLTIQQLTNILKKAAKECNVPGHISTHSLRKTFAYHMIKSNPNNDEVKFALQKMLNHNDFKTTLTYCGLTQDAVDKYRATIQDGLL